MNGQAINDPRLDSLADAPACYRAHRLGRTRQDFGCDSIGLQLRRHREGLTHPGDDPQNPLGNADAGKDYGMFAGHNACGL
jgi:hypothetical protein